MQSLDLNKLIGGFSKWFKLDKNIVKKAPSEKGVYVIRRATGKKFARLKGESDILYIGKSESAKGLKQRFSHYIKPGRTQ